MIYDVNFKHQIVPYTDHYFSANKVEYTDGSKNS